MFGLTNVQCACWAFLLTAGYTWSLFRHAFHRSILLRINMHIAIHSHFYFTWLQFVKEKRQRMGGMHERFGRNQR